MADRDEGTGGRQAGRSTFNSDDLCGTGAAKRRTNSTPPVGKRFAQPLNPDVFYSLELTGPLNRILVAYPEHELRLLAAWDRETQAEIDIRTLRVWRLRFLLVKTYPMTAIGGYYGPIWKRFGPHELEGAVLADLQRDSAER